MASNVSQQCRKNSAWCVALGITFLGVFLSASARAAVFTVNSPADVRDITPGDKLCHTGATQPTCTLRAAIQEANALGGDHEIILPSLPPANAYVLTIVDELFITSNITITGGGAATTIIDGNKGTRPISRVLTTNSGTNVRISGVTIRNGSQSGESGGGIRNGGTLTLTSSTVSGNSSTNSGGGIFNTGTLTLISSTVSGNSTRNSSLSGGGAISNAGTLTLTNSTVSGNSTTINGGGITNFGTANLFNSTVTSNRADADNNFVGTGGGVFNNVGATLTFQNTIIAENFDTFFGINECAGTLTSNGNNLLGSSNPGCTIVGSPVTIANSRLGPLQNNGGPTQTHDLLVGSPAIDAGNPGGCRDQFGALLTTDQRGFPRSVDGNNDSVATCDIGAYELLPGSTSMVAALLPSSRSVQVNTPATVFATIINTGQVIAAACSIAPLTSVPASFVYQATNQVTSTPNTPVNIGPGAAQSFVLALTPTAPFPPTEVQFSFNCTNSTPALINSGLNTLLFSASATPVPDIVSLAATTTNDGIVNIPGQNETGAFSTVNVRASESITASADTGSATLPLNIFLCQTNSATGQCISAIGPSVTTQINANATPTFAIFVQGNGNVPFDPAANRVFVRFRDGGGVTRGSTSVAMRTQ